jgi:hypothetical protein
MLISQLIPMEIKEENEKPVENSNSSGNPQNRSWFL